MAEDKKPVKTNGKRNRSAGKNWELSIIKQLKLKGLYPHCVSTRSESRSLDNAGIDIMNRNEGLVGMMVDSIQAKSEARHVPYPKLLDRIRAAGRSHPVVFHQQTARSGTKFMVQDTFAICYLDTYIELITCRKVIREIKAHLKELPAEHRKLIEETIARSGL